MAVAGSGNSDDRASLVAFFAIWTCWAFFAVPTCPLAGSWGCKPTDDVSVVERLLGGIAAGGGLGEEGVTVVAFPSATGSTPGAPRLAIDFTLK